jgi:formylglycine-generating enzyme required for sulfatase activity
MNTTSWMGAAVAALVLTGGVVGAQPLPPRVVSQPDGAEMVVVPEGSFTFGAKQEEIKALLKKLKAGWADIYAGEHKKQTVTLPAFYIDRLEVTNEHYNRFVGAAKGKPSRFARYPQLNAPKQPVVGIGWEDAEAYCRWSGKRLPTEEEWEKAARGTDGRAWPWGNESDEKLFNGKAAEYSAPVAVGSFPRGDSTYGVADMAGNVWEMTSSTWQGDAKAMRGGSFLNRLAEVRVTVRWAPDDPSRGTNWLGFRCAADAGTAQKLYGKPSPADPAKKGP